MKPTNIDIRPAARLQQVSEYYFSRKLKEIARRRAELSKKKK